MRKKATAARGGTGVHLHQRHRRLTRPIRIQRCCRSVANPAIYLAAPDNHDAHDDENKNEHDSDNNNNKEKQRRNILIDDYDLLSTLSPPYINTHAPVGGHPTVLTVQSFRDLPGRDASSLSHGELRGTAIRLREVTDTSLPPASQRNSTRASEQLEPELERELD
jgi:hypothetical protein